jgi:anti-sigma regulatory factor (Ser/Thr protein kinase)
MAVQTAETVAGAGEHVVQFYDDEADLARAVGGYLLRGVHAGDAAVVIATPSHRRAFHAELAAGGVDVIAARLDGTLTWLDAAATMARFTSRGRIDPAAFRAVLGGLVRQTGRTGRAVRAYGEMVALLWKAGDVVGAIELEKLWDELARELRFSLWCAYHCDSPAMHAHADALHEVCDLHTGVVDEAAARFEARADAPLAARRFVSSVLARRPYEGRASAPDAQLVVSELATNAVVHAGGTFSVSVRYRGSAMRISVRDKSPAAPILRNYEPASLSGRGLPLVAMIAEDWGVETSPDGKTVWAELALR